MGLWVIGEELIGAEAIARRVADLGAELSRDYAGKTPILVGILNSAVPFLADLTRAISIPCEMDFIAVSKFDAVEGIRIEKDTAAALEGRHVVLVDDAFDTGLTLQYVSRLLRSRTPASLAVCVLFERPGHRHVEIEIDYCGFKVPVRELPRYTGMETVHE